MSQISPADVDGEKKYADLFNFLSPQDIPDIRVHLQKSFEIATFHSNIQLGDSEKESLFILFRLIRLMDCKRE